MPVRATVRRSSYQDSVMLMGVAVELRALPGVREAAALMGTPANHELLASAGLATQETRAAGPEDLVLAVDVETDAPGAAAPAAARAAAPGAPRAFFDEPRRARESTGRVLPRTLDSALRQLPDASLATISCPRAHAKLGVLTALR